MVIRLGYELAIRGQLGMVKPENEGASSDYLCIGQEVNRSCAARAVRC